MLISNEPILSKTMPLQCNNEGAAVTVPLIILLVFHRRIRYTVRLMALQKPQMTIGVPQKSHTMFYATMLCKYGVSMVSV